MPPEFAGLVRVDLDLPRPRLLQKIEWRWSSACDHVEVLLPSGRWSQERDWVADVLGGLESGADFRAIVDAFAKRHPDERHTRWADFLVRQYLVDLHGRGAVDLGLPPTPASFAGRYEPERLLGTGGFGMAWLSRDRTTSERVVVKRAWSYFHRLSVSNESLATEASILRRLDHPGVARLHDEFVEDGRVGLVREFVEGHGLLRGMRSPAQIAADVAEVGSIVAHAHERGLLVLDMGPTNFYRRQSDGRIMAIDLGLCVDRPPEDGAIRLRAMSGSRGYTSPEMRERREASARSDVWSLGALAFALLVGRPISDKWSDAQVAERLPPGSLADVVRKTTARDPAARPATAAETTALFEEAARAA